MTQRRPLHETLSEIADGLVDIFANLPLQTCSIEINLPIDLRFPEKNGELVGELPLFRLRTAFDPEPAKLYIVLGETSI